MLQLCVIAACAAPTAQAQSTPQHRQVDALFAPYADRATPGCAVGISRDGKLDYAQGYGSANLETGGAITPATIFHAASLNKQFVAFSILLLQQDGKLALDDDIHRHIPELPDYGVPVTLRQLMHHTSGMREQGQLLQLAGWRTGDVTTDEDILGVIKSQRSLNYRPGSEVLYTNAAYTLLGEVVVRRSSMRQREFARSRIFAPLGMRDSFFRDDGNEPTPGRAIGYSPRAGGGWQIATPLGGAASLSTTVGDMLEWQRNLADGRVGGKDVAALMQTSGILDSGVAHGYGGGLRIEHYRGLRTVSHDGLNGGYRADTVTFPDHGLSVAVLCNNGSAVAWELSRRIADIYLEDRMAPLQPPRVALEAGRVARLAGLYWSPTTDEIVRLELVDGALRPRFRQENLHHIGANAFQLGDGVERWRFADDGATLSIWDSWPVPRIFERMDEPVVTEGLQRYAGTYRSRDLGAYYVARMEEGKLTLHFGRNARAVLEPASGDRFFSTSLGTVTFTRTEAGEIAGLTVSSRRLRRFAAERMPGPAPSAE
ncbi:serine hydrolase [Telluria beijingensis]|uniref:serine hydrolase n=1 Tax=Telluria beijingensis TaxID=3068633 RepID=UPI0027960D1C|nr:serine hydrolase [Massilia sp. REN29]